MQADPLSLLGLVAMWEHFGDQWRDRATPDSYGEVLDIAGAKDEYSGMDDEAFARLVAHLALLFAALRMPLSPSVTRHELANLARNLSEPRT